MSKQKWSIALKRTVENIKAVTDLNNGEKILKQLGVDMGNKIFEAVVLKDSISDAVCCEIHTNGKIYAVAMHNGVVYSEERVISAETAKFIFYGIALITALDDSGSSPILNPNVFLKALGNLEDGSNKVVPWEPLSFTTTIPWASALSAIACIQDGKSTFEYVTETKKFNCNDKRSTDRGVPGFETQSWIIKDDAYSKLEQERIINNALVEGYVPTTYDKLFVQRLHAWITKKGYAPSFFLYGPAGTGKSEFGKYLSSKTGIPYTFITCSAMTNEADLRGKPNKLSTTGPIVKFCKRMVKEFWGRNIETSDIDSDNITYSLTELVLAAKYGWILEIQEPAHIINAGTLGFLNCTLDTNRTLTLPNGEQIKLHPYTTFVFTTNVDYEGCNPFNLSLLSRIGYSKRVDMPSEREQVDRVISVTGYQGPRKDVELIIQCITELNHIIADNDISQGICDMRSAINCITDYQLCGGSLRQSARLTIEDKASIEPGYEDEIQVKLDSILGEF